MSRVRRTTAALFAAFQLLGAAAWPLVDARLEAAQQRNVTHIESERATPCAPGHDDEFCQVCRTFSVAGHAAVGTLSIFVAAPVRVVASAAQPEVLRLQTFHPAHGSRAPPLS